ncbi:SWI/SNF-related matrix-associated actin-dependent regulator of chromatin subfamily E member 1 [Armadillidium nasatum]|uniref:SWI/SNF-related matrix-associated actin-dependent regulator of chromatin subfamily E member 1 n=1 Tax=Armadillidium nasatum TaxID=96803 RepID=A0A5N5T4T6_9CRUS|nr:SWI/SNF-related matrix-associated actin-dependent regulator of chromatin subfamily E member 1 [Armadillidium nasatum]
MVIDHISSRSSSQTQILRDRLVRAPSSIGGKSGDVVPVNPFTTPVHGHPSFNPQKIGGSKIGISTTETRAPKPPKAPDKPLMPYMRYSRKVWDQVKAAHPDHKLWEIGKLIRLMWKDLPEADKQEFVDEYENEKTEYEKALKAYHASPSYQAYLNAKNNKSFHIASEEKEILDRSSGGTTLNKLDRRIDIQPAEDEEDYEDGLSMKRVAHSRYVRNHRLINEIFSDTVVPDVRTVVTSQRLIVLRRQVQSLTMHQKKLEAELDQIEDKFEEKKRKFLEAGKNFQLELKKVKMNAPKLDDVSFAQMVEKQKDLIRKEAEERQKGMRPLSNASPNSTQSQSTTGNEGTEDCANASPQSNSNIENNENDTTAMGSSSTSQTDSGSSLVDQPNNVHSVVATPGQEGKTEEMETEN